MRLYKIKNTNTGKFYSGLTWSPRLRLYNLQFSKDGILLNRQNLVKASKYVVESANHPNMSGLAIVVYDVIEKCESEATKKQLVEKINTERVVQKLKGNS